MVTGATGFVGAHSTAALLAAGHRVTALVREPRRVGANLGALGVDGVDVVVGDMTDPAAVGAALAGCDAVLHCAAVVSAGRGGGAAALGATPRGAEVVIGSAVERGLDPVVHVSSVAALFRPGLDRLHPGLPPVDGQGPYGRSKAAAERYVRRLQEAGAPVVTTYPAAVVGPAAGAAAGEAAAGIRTSLRLGLMPTGHGAWSVIDVRDLARVHVAIVEPGRGPRRYMCGGHFLTLTEQAGIYRRLTGRRFPVVPLPGAVVRLVGAVLEDVARVAPLDPLLTRERADLLLHWVPTDDGPLAGDLGIGLRDPEETFAAAIRSLHALGRLPAAAAGRLVTARPPAGA